MSAFKKVCKDNVILIKSNGEKIENIKAHVQSNLILIPDGLLPIEEGDKIIRDLPNGMKENYVVLDRGFYPTFNRIKAHYQVKVYKDTPLNKSSNKKENITNNYHVSGSNAKVNVNSIDNSINVINEDKYKYLFTQLREVIVENVDVNNEEILEAINLMEESQGKPSFKDKYDNFISKSANYMTLLTPFIPALTNILTESV